MRVPGVAKRSQTEKLPWPNGLLNTRAWLGYRPANQRIRYDRLSATNGAAVTLVRSRTCDGSTRRLALQGHYPSPVRRQ